MPLITNRQRRPNKFKVLRLGSAPEKTEYPAVLPHKTTGSVRGNAMEGIRVKCPKCNAVISITETPRQIGEIRLLGAINTRVYKDNDKLKRELIAVNRENEELRDKFDKLSKQIVGIVNGLGLKHCNVDHFNDDD